MSVPLPRELVHIGPVAQLYIVLRMPEAVHRSIPEANTEITLTGRQECSDDSGELQRVLK